MNKKRKCIFTGKEADCSVSVGQDKHNWAKKVPCTKKWCEMFLGKPLNSTQIKLVELFYEQEVARIKVDNIEAQMAEIRANAAYPVVKEHKKRIENPFFYVDEPEDFTLEDAKEVEKMIIEDSSKAIEDWEKSLAEKAINNVNKILISTDPSEELVDSVKNLEEIVNKDNFEELLLKSAEQAVEITKKDFNETMDEMDKIEEDSKDFWE